MNTNCQCESETHQWTTRELSTLGYAHKHKICGLNPDWGKCSHKCCRDLWQLTAEEEMTMESLRYNQLMRVKP